MYFQEDLNIAYGSERREEVAKVQCLNKLQ